MAQIRRTQFLTTYGPGAILESVNGPRVILSVELSKVFPGNHADFEITDQRLSRGMLEGAGILRLPSNAELGKPENTPIYSTKRFPLWALCTRHGILYQKHAGTNEKTACPQCGEYDDKDMAWEQANRQAIRFVRACPEGHLDDVDWVYIVHQQRSPNCRPTWLRWHGSGALKNITIECPLCKSKINLGVAYSREWLCSGRFPERETGQPSRAECAGKARIIQRGAANLRIPEILTGLVIPKCDSNLHRKLQISAIVDGLTYASHPPASKAEFIQSLNNLVQRNRLSRAVVDEINQYDESEILSAIADMLNLQIPHDAYEMRRDEFHELLNAATNGHPPVRPRRPGDVPQFEVERSKVRQLTQNGRLRLRVTPINRLQVIMVQRGYRRIPAGQIQQAALVDTAFEFPADPGRRWYVGSELSGEGLFIDLDIAHHPQNRLQLAGPVAGNWWQAWNSPDEYTSNTLMPVDRHQFHPVFVWWHTFAHRLINALSVDSGYSSAAIRERIFIDIDPETGTADGGLLLYTSQPGGDGTLGGLIALVPEFERVLERALHNLDTCSNDPLCGEEYFGPRRYNGAACYACLLVSETSCEHRNMSLDRNLLLERRP